MTTLPSKGDAWSVSEPGWQNSSLGRVSLQATNSRKEPSTKHLGLEAFKTTAACRNTPQLQDPPSLSRREQRGCGCGSFLTNVMLPVPFVVFIISNLSRINNKIIKKKCAHFNPDLSLCPHPIKSYFFLREREREAQ